MLQYYGLSNKEIPFAAERSKSKWGKYTVGSGIKIVSEENARKLRPDYFFVMPYGFINEFIKREKKWLKGGGKFMLPYPKFKVIHNEKKSASFRLYRSRWIIHVRVIAQKKLYCLWIIKKKCNWKYQKYPIINRK